MTKQTEALRMALRWFTDVSTNNEDEVIQACKDALESLEKDPPISRNEQPADGIELEWYCKGWDDAEKDLATQEPKSPTILARLPNGTTASNVYEAYEAGLKEGKAETQKPVLVNATTHDGQTYKIEVSAPSREWVGLSDAEVDDVFNLRHHTFKEFAHAIEAKLREKNNG